MNKNNLHIIQYKDTKNIVNCNNYYNKLQKYQNKLIQKGGIHVGQRVIEQDSKIHGTIIEIHNRYSHTNAIMKGDNGQLYQHHISHFIDENVQDSFYYRLLENDRVEKEEE